MSSKSDAMTASAWREAADLLRFCLEAAAISGAIVLTAWIFSGAG